MPENQFTRSFLQEFVTNPVVVTLFWCGISFLIIRVVLWITRKILQKVFAVPLALHKKILHILVPKEAAKKEEEAKSSKKDYKELIAVMDAFYSALGSLKPKQRLKGYFLGRDDQIALEIIAKDGLVKFYAVIPDYIQQYFEQQLHAQYPSAQITEVEDYNIFRPKGAIATAPLVLTNTWILPLKTYKKMDTDPLSGLTNALSKVETTQGAAIQVMMRTAPKKWRYKSMHVAREMQKGKTFAEAISKTKGLKFVNSLFYSLLSGFTNRENQQQQMPPQQQKTPLEQEMIKGMEEKASKQGFEVNVRVVAAADQPKIANALLFNIVNSFAQYTGPESGIAYKKQKYFLRKPFIHNFVYRVFDERRKFILSSEELTSVYHLPTSSIETPNIEWLKARAAPPPVNAPKEGIILGESEFRGKKVLVRMSPDDRRRHFYVIGQTGSGKTTIQTNMIIQDIRNGEGCCFIDPHGDAIDAIMECIPPERADDVILFDPADFERPQGLNLLEYDPQYPEQKGFAVNEMILIMDKLYDLRTTGGPMFESYMRNAMLLIMDDPESGSTIMEIPKVLSDEEYRKHKLSKTNNPTVYDFWTKEAQKAGGEASLANMVPYITSKLNQFVSNDIMRPIIGQQKSAFNFREVMDNKKILLVRLSKGRLGDPNAYLLGMIIVGKLTMAALSRTDIEESKRTDFFLYIDEFQNFITDSIATILSEARKYRLALIIAHQFIAQLSPKQGETKVRDAVFGNVGTMACFRVGVDDSELMAKQLAPVFNEFDVMNIERFHAYIRLLIKGTPSRPFSMATLPPPKGDPKIREAIRQLSRFKNGRDREIVEAEILERAKTAWGGQEEDDWEI